MESLDTHLCSNSVGTCTFIVLVHLFLLIIDVFCRAVCGAPDVDWKTAKDFKAPPGWTASGFNWHVSNLRYCGNGWNAYANGASQGQLYAAMKGYGRATVQYSDCWSEGSAVLYLNGKQLDRSPQNTGQLRTYRWSACVTCDVSLLSANQETVIVTLA